MEQQNKQTDQITVNARYGLKHALDVLSENTYRAYDVSRFSYREKDEHGRYTGVDYIDFDGGPFLHVGYPLTWDASKVIREFVINMSGDELTSVDIVTEPA